MRIRSILGAAACALLGAVLVACFVGARGLTGENLTTGPGYDTIRWALDPTAPNEIVIGDRKVVRDWI